MSENVNENVGGERRIDRAPTTWVNFVSPEYARDETVFRTYVTGPKTFVGKVEYFGNSEARLGGKAVKGKALVISSEGKRFGFNFPEVFYHDVNTPRTFVFYDPNKLENGKEITITYLGTFGNTKIILIY